jgi:hypothetical protein
MIGLASCEREWLAGRHIRLVKLENLELGSSRSIIVFAFK